MSFVSFISLNVNIYPYVSTIIDNGVRAIDDEYYLGSKNSGNTNLIMNAFMIGQQCYYLYDDTINSGGSYGVIYNPSVNDASTSTAHDFLYCREFYNYNGLNCKFGTVELGNTTVPAGIENGYSSLEEACNDIFKDGFRRIEYIGGAIVVSGPKIVTAGKSVTAYLAMPQGITVTESDIKVTKGSSLLPFNYSNGTIVFTAE